MLTIFYSWLSDTPNKTNRNFIRAALEAAIRTIGKDLGPDDSLRIDQDTADVPGTPEIANTILRKIENAYIFLADLTMIARTNGEKQVPNPNVMIELGYAMRCMGTDRIITVMNEHYGPVKDGVPFDLAHRRWPIRYSLTEEAGADERQEIKKKLVADLETAIRAIVAAFEPTTKDAFVGVPSVWKSSSFLGDHERLAKLTPFGEIEEASDIFWTNEPQAFLRLIPEAPLPEKSSLELEGMLRDLPPFGRVGSIWTARNKSGAVSFEARPDQHDAKMISQLFRHGEIWGIDRKCLQERKGKRIIPTGLIVEIFTRGLRSYLSFYGKQLSGKLPVRIMVGVSGIEDYAIAVDSYTIAGHCVEDEVIDEMILDKLDVDPMEVLKPFFGSIFEACGVRAPEM